MPARKTVRLKIDSLAYGPYGVGREQQRVVLVPLTAPGDEVEARIVAEKKNYSTADLVRLLKPSPQRQPPPCAYFPHCGGCPWQHVSYPHQLYAKENIVVQNLRRIGHFDDFRLLPIVRSPDQYHYRRRIRLQCSKEKMLGFHSAFSHKLVPIDACLIADDELNRKLPAAREWTATLQTALRNVEIVKADREGTAILVGRTAAEFAGPDDVSCARFLAQNGAICGLVIAGRGWRRAWGETKVTFHSQDALPLSVDADVFSQVNQVSSKLLVRELLNWGAFTEQDRILELYAGAGNLTLAMAQRAHEVVAVEQDTIAVEGGRTNSRRYQLENIRWLCADAGTAVRNLSREKEHFTKVILNPPRTGAKGFEVGLASFAARRIFYVSCNPATLARDLAALRKLGYALARVRPFDLFPHTFHVETLAEMVR
jgi:23S rRNA (uracil1939-C5)-methyltransferase